MPTETPAPPTPTATRVVVPGTPAPASLQPAASPAATRGTAAPQTSARNVFGVQAGPDSWSIERRITVARTLGASFYRPADVIIDQWRNSCIECPSLASSGFRVVLGVRATQTTARRLTDVALFQRSLAGIIDQYHPEIVFIEHDESRTDNSAFMAIDYTAELKAACETAHNRRIKCANGGMAGQQALMALWADKYEQSGSGAACQYAQKAMDAATATTLCGTRSLDKLSAQMQTDISRGRAFLAGYKEAGADFVSLLWNLNDAGVMADVAAYARTVTGLPVVIKELSLTADNAPVVSAWLQKAVDLGLSAAIWGGPEAGKPGALINSDGSQRTNGRAFQEFIQTRLK